VLPWFLAHGKPGLVALGDLRCASDTTSACWDVQSSTFLLQVHQSSGEAQLGGDEVFVPGFVTTYSLHFGVRREMNTNAGHHQRATKEIGAPFHHEKLDGRHQNVIRMSGRARRAATG
jgi:hypothetical protein